MCAPPIRVDSADFFRLAAGCARPPEDLCGRNPVRSGTLDAMSEALIIYDGDCGFCSASARWLRRHVQPRAQLVPWQELDLAALSLTAEQCTTSVQWVGPAGQRADQSAAVAAALRSGRQPWASVGGLLGQEWLRPLADKAYRFVARHRGRLPGATDACRADAAA